MALDKVNDLGLSKNINEKSATDAIAGKLKGIIIFKIIPNQF